MKLYDVMEKEETEEKGTYAGVRFCYDTVSRIKAYIEENEIAQPVPDEKLHTTLLYSRKFLPDYTPQGEIDPPLVGKGTKFDVWESQPNENGEKSNCLVMEYDCPELTERHESLMKEHGGTFDFDEYKPHVTLSYNIGDMDASKLNPADIGDLNLVTEYGEDLNMNWAKDNT